MTARSSLALVALVLVAATAAIVLALRDTEERATPEPATRDALATTTREESRSELASDAPPASSVVEPRADARTAVVTDLLGTDLYIAGFLREPSGKRITDRDVKLVLTRPDGTQTTAPDANGAFAFGPFDPGAFDLAVRSRRHVATELHVDLLPTDARRVREIVLTPLAEILVRARTPDGEPLARRMMSAPEFGYAFRARAIAHAVSTDGSRTSPDATGDYVGIGGPAEEWNAAEAPPDAIGRLYVPALPVRVSLRIGERVIDTQTAHTNELLFVLGLDRMVAALSTVRAIAIDGEARSPTPLLHAWIAASEEHGRNYSIDGTNHDGLLEIRGLPDGPTPLRIGAPGYATKELGVFLQGGLLDLGPIALERTVTLRGRVVDADGNAVDHVVELVPQGARKDAEPIWARATTTTPLQVELAPGKYVVRSTNRFPELWEHLPLEERAGFLEQWTPSYVRPREIEVTRTTHDDLVLPLERAYRVDLVLQSTRTTRLTIETREGQSIWSRTGAASTVHLLPGDYRATWTRSDNDVIQRDFTVGTTPLTLHLP